MTYPDITVLYGLGTVVSLIGTGFLIGVRPYLFKPLYDLTDLILLQTVYQANEARKHSLAGLDRSNAHFVIAALFPTSHLSPDVQARSRRRNHHLPSYDYHDFRLCLCTQQRTSFHQ